MLYPFKMHRLRLFVVVFQEIQCLLKFHCEVGRQGIDIYPCIKLSFLPQCFPLSAICIIHISIKNVLAETVLCGFPRKYSVYIILTVTMFVTSQSFISLPCFMFVSAAVSEIHGLEPEQEGEEVWKRKFSNYHLSQAYKWFNESYLLSTSTH